MDAPLTLQSGEVETPTTMFVDGDSNAQTVAEVQAPVEETFYHEQLDLATFFRRPVEIYTGTWTIDGEVDVVFNPWALWAANPRISNRLNNFYLFNGTMHVKLVINGNPFSWGCLMMSYCPNSNVSFVQTTDPRYFAPSTFFADIMQASQRPHVLIDPTTSKGGELTIPLHSINRGARLTSGAFNNWGEVWLRSLNTLRQLGSTKALNYTVYAWCDGVELSGPTQTNMQGLVAQSGEMVGSISSAMNSVSQVAGALKTLPVVGKWMTAAQMAAQYGAEIATVFGYSKPTCQDKYVRTLSTAVTNLAVCDGVDSALSLAVTPNQNLPIDAANVGFPTEDMMAFSNIAKIPSLVMTTTWAPSATRNTVLASIPITPMLNWQGTRALLNAQAMQLTPMGMVATNFRYWKGSMRIRLQFVANSFHRGRVLITYDPVISAASPEEQTVRCMVVDIAEMRDFEFDVGWVSERTVAETAVASTDLANKTPTTTRRACDADSENGCVTVYVLNELISSTTSSTAIGLNVWVSMPDLQVVEPYFDHMASYSMYPTAPTVALASEPMQQQAGLMESEIYGGSAPLVHDLFPISDTTDWAGVASMDATRSFRKLLKRYCYMRTTALTNFGTTAGFQTVRVNVPVTPVAYSPGYTASGVVGASTNKRNVDPLTPLVFAFSCYSFYRGGFRVGIRNLITNYNLSLSRGYRQAVPFSLQQTDLTADAYSAWRRNSDISPQGTMSFILGGERSMETFEVPWTTHRKFASTTPSTTASTLHENLVLVLDGDRYAGSANTVHFHFETWLAIAEDTTFLWFRGVPAVYSYSPP